MLAITPSPTTVRQLVRERIELEAGRSVEGLILFGSRARGDARGDSDWDILAMLNDEVDWPAVRATLRRLQGELTERLGEKVSILPLRWRDAREHGGLIRNVAREGQRL